MKNHGDFTSTEENGKGKKCYIMGARTVSQEILVTENVF